MKGGYRANAGRPKGSLNKKKKSETRILSGAGFLSKAQEFAEFYKGLLDRSSLGKRPSDSEKQQMKKLAGELSKSYEAGGDNADRPIEELPLSFLLTIMNNPGIDLELRVRVASICAPFCHRRYAEKSGIKEEKQKKAKQVGSGRFATGRPPIKLVK
jgi:hypothetical protein